MKKFIGVLMSLLVAVPLLASAHEHQSFEINGAVYDITIGSMNEPVAVDDKSGVEFEVVMTGHEHMEASDHHGAEGGVPGLEETLKVELIAGDKKKVLDIRPTYGEPGSYYAPFYPTVATTLSYRIFGTIADTPFDYTFTCNPAGHAPAAEDESRVELSDKVARIHKSGSFGCPVDKAPMGFPEESSEILSLKEDAQGGAMVGWVAGAIALAAFALTFRRRS